MNKVAIMTDSIASIPWEIAMGYNIRVIPFHIMVDGKDYLETEVDKAGFYTRLREKEDLPTTSAPSVGEYLEVYQELSRKAETILYISVSSAFTMAYNAAIRAKEIAREELSKATIEVFDSQAAVGSQFFIVLEAAKAVAQGGSLQEVTQIASAMVAKVRDFGLLTTLHYVERGGRITKALALLGSMLHLQPILELDPSTGGRVKPLGSVRTTEQGMHRLIELMEERSEGRNLHVVVGHGDMPAEAESLKRKVSSRCRCAELYVIRDSLLVAIHAGPGLLRLAFYSSD